LENQLSKGLRRVSRKFVFEQKFSRKILFPWEYYNVWDSNLVSRLVPTVLYPSAAKKFCFCILKK
jgi:hypothetical protein